MKLERKSDAIALARAPSAEHLKEGGVHVSQAIGLEKRQKDCAESQDDCSQTTRSRARRRNLSHIPEIIKQGFS
eukprot:scaffold194_cov80-Skeletonema_marinoi.AAC.1